MQIKIFTIFSLILIGLAIFSAVPAEATVFDDSGCANINGTCQDNCASTCSGPGYQCRTGLCTGPAARKCCAPASVPNAPSGGSRTTGGTSGDGGDTIELPNPLGVRSFTELIYRIIDFLSFTIGPAAVTLMILIGAFQILMAGGNPEKVTTGRKTITYAVIGFALLLLADGIIYVIANLVGANLP